MAQLELEEFLNKGREEDACVTIRVAARQIGCSDAIVTALKRAGHLDCKRVRGRFYPRKASLARFDRDYESMAHLARRAGVPVKRIYARLDFSKFRHVKVKAVQYTTAFVLRRDVPKVEKLVAQL